MSSRYEQIVLVFLAFLVLSGAGFRLWMREGDIVVEVVEKEPEQGFTQSSDWILSESEGPLTGTSPVQEARLASPASETTSSTIPLGAPQSNGEADRKKINVNTASLEELDSLPGIGPKLAQRVIEDRSMFGRYETVDDLERVKGIGSETVERLRPFVIAE